MHATVTASPTVPDDCRGCREPARPVLLHRRRAEIVVDHNGISVFDLLRYRQSPANQPVPRSRQLGRWLWRRQCIQIQPPPVTQHRDPLGNLRSQLLRRGVGTDAVDGVGLVDVLHGAESGMAIRRGKAGGIKRFLKAFLDLILSPNAICSKVSTGLIRLIGQYQLLTL
jgi:hypothetical protein